MKFDTTKKNFKYPLSQSVEESNPNKRFITKPNCRSIIIPQYNHRFCLFVLSGFNALKKNQKYPKKLSDFYNNKVLLMLSSWEALSR